MEERTVTVRRPEGVHLRVASEIVTTCLKGRSDVRIVKDGKEADGASILEVLLLEATPGSSVKISVSGDDEIIVAGLLSDLFSEGSGI